MSQSANKLHALESHNFNPLNQPASDFIAPFSEEGMPHYLRGVTKNRSSCIEKTIVSHSLELESLEYKINNLQAYYSYAQIRAWRARRRKVKNTLKFLKSLVKDTIRKRTAANALAK
jgi:hypothetical protein